MRPYSPLLLCLILLLFFASTAQSIPSLQVPGSVIVVSNGGQAADMLDRVLWRQGNDVSDPAPNWREPAFNDGAWVTARPAWRGNWAPVGPLTGPTGPDHIWYSRAGALTPDTGNGIPFATRFDGADYDNGYLVPDGPDVLFLRKNFCLPLNAVPASPVAGQLEVTGIYQYVAWMNGNNQIGTGGGPTQDTYDIYAAIVPLYAGHNVLAVRARNLYANPEAALIYRLTIDYNIDPQALTIVAPTDVIVGQPLTLDAQISGTPGEPPYTYNWDLGDGNLATGNPIVHTYMAAGTYTVLLTVDDSYGCTGTVSLPITVHAQPPLSVTKSDSPDPVVEGGLLDYSLTVHNGGTINLTNVAVTDTVPVGTTFVGCAPAPCGQAGGVVTWSGLTVPAGGDGVVSFRVQVGTGLSLVVNDQYSAGAVGALPAQGAPITTTVVQPTVTPTPTPTSPPSATPTGTLPPSPTATPGSPTCTVPPTTPSPRMTSPPSTPALAAPHLTLIHTVSPDTASPGMEVIYHTIVSNGGTAVAAGVVLAVEVPASLIPGEVTLSAPVSTAWTGNVLWVAWGDVAPQTAVWLDLHATVRIDAAAGDADSLAQVEDYGLEAHAILHILPQVLPETGVSALLEWAWLLLAGGLVIAGLFLHWQRHRSS